MPRKFVAAVLAASLLPVYAAGKGEEFERFLKEYETARQIVVNGPFAAIDIDYRKPGSYFTSARLFYWRVVFKDKIYLDRVDNVQHWEGVEPSTFFVYKYDDAKSPLHVLSHKNGKPVMERIDLAASHWHSRGPFRFGYPIDAQTRYFPRHYFGDGGFLLKAHPLTAMPLPEGLGSGCCTLSINTLAGISPDGEAYAYVDKPDTPTALVVVSRQGKKQTPFPVPMSRIFDPRKSEDASPYEPLWRWLPMHFKWGQDAAGNWDVTPQIAAPGVNGTAALESLFISPRTGYRTCFAPSNSSCAAGWREASGDDERRVFGQQRERASYGYVPKMPLKAFDAPVELLIFGPAYSSTGYELYLRGRAENVVDAIKRRFASEKVDYLRVNQCPPDSINRYSCLPLLKEKFQWPLYLEDQLASILERSEEYGAVFVTANGAFTVRQLSSEVTAVLTLARYDFSAAETGR